MRGRSLAQLSINTRAPSVPKTATSKRRPIVITSAVLFKSIAIAPIFLPHKPSCRSTLRYPFKYNIFQDEIQNFFGGDNALPTTDHRRPAETNGLKKEREGTGAEGCDLDTNATTKDKK
jgi:hypothetical protein